MTLTTTNESVRLPLTSADVLAERAERLKDLFPEVFVEGQIDFDRLRNALGDFVGEGRERYGLSWAGKADAIRAIQAPSVGTLVPCPEESVNFDTTENLFIEGDNLEVLKLLQKSYYGKVKMIYIDPPYNTGGEFIYPDNFREGLEDYLKYSGQTGEGGIKLSTNTETSGRYHSKWLDMMYPRIFLARNLLSPAGVLYVSIDDHEHHNLRCLLDEVFGPECYLGTIVRATGQTTGQDSGGLGSSFDYVLCYSREPDIEVGGIPLSKKDVARFSETDERGKFCYWQLRKTGSADRREDRKRMFFPVDAPDGSQVWPIGPGGYESRWRCGPDTYKRFVAENLIFWKQVPDDKGGKKWWPYVKNYLDGRTKRPSPLWTDIEGSKKATRQLRELFGAKVFDHPKPLGLIQRLIQISAEPENGDIVLDFFAGSGTTGEAVMRLNNESDIQRRFILVQLPEPVDSESCDTIAALCRRRLELAAASIQSGRNSPLTDSIESQSDCGFKSFRLTSSNFKLWDGTQGTSIDELQDQLRLFADHVSPDRNEHEILCELMLKAGLPLTAAIEDKLIVKQKVYSIADGLLAICMANPITQECLRGIIALGPQRVICLDAAFGGNDQLKTNTVLEMKSHGIEFRTV